MKKKNDESIAILTNKISNINQRAVVPKEVKFPFWPVRTR
jgi:hypothetical protein